MIFFIRDNKNKIIFFYFILIFNLNIFSLNTKYYFSSFKHIAQSIYSINKFEEINLKAEENILYYGKKCIRVTDKVNGISMIFDKNKRIIFLNKIYQAANEKEFQYFNILKKVEGNFKKLNIPGESLILEGVFFIDNKFLFKYKEIFKGFFCELNGITMTIDCEGDLISYSDNRLSDEIEIKFNISEIFALKKAKKIFLNKYASMIEKYTVTKKIIITRPNIIDSINKNLDYHLINLKNNEKVPQDYIVDNSYLIRKLCYSFIFEVKLKNGANDKIVVNIDTTNGDFVGGSF